jgi:hypothetical protein
MVIGIWWKVKLGYEDNDRKRKIQQMLGKGF